MKSKNLIVLILSLIFYVGLILYFTLTPNLTSNVVVLPVSAVYVILAISFFYGNISPYWQILFFVVYLVICILIMHYWDSNYDEHNKTQTKYWIVIIFAMAMLVLYFACYYANRPESVRSNIELTNFDNVNPTFSPNIRDDQLVRKYIDRTLQSPKIA